MRKARNNKNIENKENLEVMDIVDDNETVENAEEIDMNIDNLDEENELKEWDIADDDEIHEFLSRDLDVVTRTRQRLREKQEAKERAAVEKKSRTRRVPKVVAESKPKKDKPAKAEKVKSTAGKPDKDILGSVVAFFKNIWGKWLDIYHKHTMQILYSTLGVLAVILLVALVATNMDGSKPVDTEEQTSSKQVEQESNEETSTESQDETLVAETEDSDIHKIVASYFDALYVQANIDEVGKYVDDVTNFNAERLTSYDKYYEAVSNIQCYKFETARVENSYVVFVTYGLKLYNIETSVPSGEALVVKQDADGKYLIHNLTDKETLDLKISNEDYVKHIDELEKQVETAFEQVLATDAEFKEVYEMMQGLANKATEQESSSETNSDDASQESTTPAQ